MRVFSNTANGAPAAGVDVRGAFAAEFAYGLFGPDDSLFLYGIEAANVGKRIYASISLRIRLSRK